MPALIVMFGVLFMAGVQIAFGGFILKWLWEWYFVPLGMPSISIIHALGICLLVDFLVYNYSSRCKYKKQEVEELSIEERLKHALQNMAEMMKAFLTMAVFTLVVGWILHFFMGG